MGTWLATIRFPDGAVRHAEYSTVTGSVGSWLHTEVCRVGDIAPSGDRCDRDRAVGEWLPSFPDRPLSALDDLVLVTVESQPDDDRWHALYCPRRAQLIGPLSDHYRYWFRDYGDLIRDGDGDGDGDGVQHICPAGGLRSRCDRELARQPAGPSALSGSGSERTAPPVPDLFADWNEPGTCRRCLFAWLSDPARDGTFIANLAVPPVPRPVPVPRRRWWDLRR